MMCGGWSFGGVLRCVSDSLDPDLAWVSATDECLDRTSNVVVDICADEVECEMECVPWTNGYVAGVSGVVVVVAGVCASYHLIDHAPVGCGDCLRCENDLIDLTNVHGCLKSEGEV